MMSVLDRGSVCSYRARLEAFWDGEVSTEERQRIAAHLGQCVACRQRVQELQSLAQTLRAYRAPASGWRDDAAFWQSLAPRLAPRRSSPLDGSRVTAAVIPPTEPEIFLAPLSLLASGVAVRGLASVALVVYSLGRWQLLPGTLSMAFVSMGRLLVGPRVWEVSAKVYHNLALTPFLAAPGQAWYLAVQATAAGLLAILAGLYAVWLWRWLCNGQVAAQGR